MMSRHPHLLRSVLKESAAIRRVRVACCLTTAFVCALAARPSVQGQQPQSQPAQPSAVLAQSTSLPATATSEEELRQRFLGKTVYLRGGYLNNALDFDVDGHLIGRSQQGSFTLCLIQVEKVRLTHHSVELQGARYGLHFLTDTPYEEPSRAFDTVNITPKKKAVRITIARERVVTPKKKRHKASQESTDAASLENPAPQNSQDAAAQEPSHPGDVPTSPSPAHAAQRLHDALDRVFAQSLDEQMIASMPDFWQLYYKAAAARQGVLPAGPAVFRQSDVDQKARLLTNIEPPSNQYAQDKGVAGLALYRVVLGADGIPVQIAVSRPIGFGLDENAVDAIRKATFQPAIKDGKPVPVLFDVLAKFRIYSKRTAPAAPASVAAAPATGLPDPQSAQHP